VAPVAPRGTARRTAAALAVLCLTGCAADGVTPAPPAPAAVTQVLTFQAFDDVGLLPNLVRAASVPGACQGGSVVHPGRADAWRCRAGETPYDPCFANTTGEELACVGDPWTREVTVLRPAAPLGRAGSNRNDPGLPPWFLELADGSRCGRTPPAGYRCSAAGAAGSAGTAGSDVGEPDTTTSLWRVRGTAGGAPLTADVRTAWY
jgi:hypothetical protein